ncbi:MAG TPA: ABC-2 family transporter protein [Candidatus Didemnitutus sp.]|nr:ABC-2 family transporter protein [Candidatus Didemnitutus sp.]
MRFSHYLNIWLTSARYSVMRTLMFRGDFFVWSLVELFWMTVNVLMVSVIYEHTNEVAGWTKYQMMLLVGTSMLIQRFLMGFFWSSIFEMGRNIRSGNFDFFMAQPGNVMFMATTRKLDLDSLINSLVAMSVVAYSAHELGLKITALNLALFAVLVVCGVIIHYSILVLCIAAAFWMTSAQGIEGSYFTLSEFSRLPRQAFRGLAEFAFVWALPMVLVSNVPATALFGRAELRLVAWVVALAIAWFTLTVFVFNRGLRRYSSASS